MGETRIPIENLTLEQVKEYSPGLYAAIREEAESERLEEEEAEATEDVKAKVIRGLKSGVYQEPANEADKKSVITAVLRGW